MNVKINEEACIGCGTCAAICPDAFEMNDEAKAFVKEGDLSAFTDKIDESKDACPVQAIEIV